MFYWQKLAFKNLSRRIQRTLIVGSIIFVGSLFIALSLAWGSGMTNQMRDNMILGSIGHIQVFSDNYVKEEAGELTNTLDRPDLTTDLLLDEASRIEEIAKESTYVENVYKRLATKGIVSTDNGTQVLMFFGIESENEAGIIKTINSGTSVIKEKEILINESIAESLKIDKGDTITTTISNPAGEMKVVELKVIDFFTNQAPWYSMMAFVDLRYFQEVLGLNDNQISEITITLNNINKTEEFREVFQQDIDDAGINSKVLDWKESGKSLNEVVDGVSMMLYVTYFLLFVIIALGIGSAMLIIVNERLKEMGTLSAIGMTSGQIIKLFIFEIVILSTLSASLGLAIANGIASYISEVGIYAGNNSNLSLIFGGDRLFMKWSYNMVIITFAWVVLVSIVSTIIVSYKAARKEPVDALKGTF